MSDLSKLSDIEKIALARSLPKKMVDGARDGLKPGIHNVDFLVRIQGSFDVGEDTTHTPVGNVPWLRVLALMFQRMGRSTASHLLRDMFLKLLVQAISDTMTETIPAGTLDKEMITIAELLKSVKEEVKKVVPEKPRRGTVRTALTAETCRAEQSKSTFRKVAEILGWS